MKRVLIMSAVLLAVVCAATHADECEPYMPGSCDDGIYCTTDVCVMTPGVHCEYTPTDAKCDDGWACTTNICDPDHWQADEDGCRYEKESANCTYLQCDPGSAPVCEPDDSGADANGCVCWGWSQHGPEPRDPELREFRSEVKYAPELVSEIATVVITDDVQEFRAAFAEAMADFFGGPGEIDYATMAEHLTYVAVEFDATFPVLGDGSNLERRAFAKAFGSSWVRHYGPYIPDYGAYWSCLAMTDLLTDDSPNPHVCLAPWYGGATKRITIEDPDWPRS